MLWAHDALTKANEGMWAGEPSGPLSAEASAALPGALGPSARSGRPRASLTVEVFASVTDDVDGVNSRYAADGRRIDLGLTAVADALDAHAIPDEAQDFKLAVLEAATDVAGRVPRPINAMELLVSHLLQINLRHAPRGVPEPSATVRFRPSEWLTLEWAPYWTAGAIAAADGKVVEAESIPVIAMIENGPAQADPLLREVLAWIARDSASFQALASNLTTDPAAAEQSLGQVAKVLAARTAPDEAKRFKNALVTLAMETLVADGQITLGTESDAVTRIRAALQG